MFVLHKKKIVSFHRKGSSAASETTRPSTISAIKPNKTKPNQVKQISYKQTSVDGKH